MSLCLTPDDEEQMTNSHTDHPLRHWDHTCPACNPGGAYVMPKEAVQSTDAAASGELSGAPKRNLPKLDAKVFDGVLYVTEASCRANVTAALRLKQGRIDQLERENAELRERLHGERE